jgi:N-formylglutamate amidohydrolase
MASREHKTITDSFQPAFKLVEPDQVAGPFIFASPHSGRIYPRSFLENSGLSALQLRSSEDAYVDKLFAHVTKQGASFIYSLVPRAYLDLNRHPYELDPHLFAGQLPSFAITDSTKVKGGLGVIARIVAQGREIYTQPLDVNEALRRINRLYFPYHAALRSIIDKTLKSQRQAILIDCHSMPSANHANFKKNPPDFVLGNLFDKSCDYELTHMVRSELQAMGYKVCINKPYAGGYITKEYGNPQNGVHVLQIEINRHLYLDERSLKKTPGFEKLRDNLRKLTQKLIEELPDLSCVSRLAAE